MIPPDRARLGVFTCGDLSDKRTASLIEEAAKGGPSKPSGSSKIANLYNSYMNEDSIETAALTPLRRHLGSSPPSRARLSWPPHLGKASVPMLTRSITPTSTQRHLFGLWAAPNFNDPEHYAAYLCRVDCNFRPRVSTFPPATG